MAISTLCLSNAYAGNLEIAPAFDLELLAYDVDGSSTINEFASQPSHDNALQMHSILGVSYQSAHLDSQLRIKNRYIELDKADDNRSYTNINFRNTLSFFSDRVLLGLNSQKSHRVSDSRLGYFSDGIAFDNLTDLTTHSASLTMRTKPKVSRYTSLQLTATDTKSGAGSLENNSFAIDGASYGAEFTAGGQFGSKSYWGVTLSKRKTKRERFEDFTSEDASIRLGAPIWERLRFVVQANHNESSLTGNRFGDNDPNSTSWGFGFEYGDIRRSYVGVLYNFRNSGQIDDDFFSYYINLVPSERTSVFAEYTKKYYGISKRLDASWKLKHFRLNATFNDDVTSYSQTQFAQVDLGLFVCPFDQPFDIANCFQPDSIDYELAPNEVSANFFETQPVLTEQVLLQKVGQVNMSYEFRRLTIAASVFTTERDFLESNFLQETQGYSVSLKWRAGRHGRFTATSRFSEVEYESESRGDDNRSNALTYAHTLSAKLSVAFTLSENERTSTTLENNFSDKRASLKVGYQFR